MNLTREGAILGTPLYLAPELWLGAPASSASDLYALGVVLYELLAGQVPQTGMTRVEMAARVPAEDAAPIASRVVDLPAGLAALIDACLDRDLSQRPDSADELCDLLEAVVARRPGLDSPYRRPSTSSTPGPERRAMFAETSAAAEPVSAHAAVAGERKVVAVLYSDLHSFALLSENREAAEIFARLNEYFDRMVEAITSHGGTVDKFIGDAVMAVFGGAVPLASPADAALGAALAMRVALHELNQQRVAAGLASLDNGTGISFGEVLYGAVGTTERKQPTVLGDVVVTALQLEAVTRKLQAPIAVSESLVEALSSEGRAVLIPLGEVTLDRRKPPMGVFGVRGAGGIS
jgi:class 3 adenylate cyclase